MKNLSKRKVENINDEKQKKLKEAFATMASTPEGTMALKHIMETCNYQKTSVVIGKEDGEIRLQSTAFNEGMRQVYLIIRKLIPKSSLKKIEI